MMGFVSHWDNDGLGDEVENMCRSSNISHFDVFSGQKARLKWGWLLAISSLSSLASSHTKFFSPPPSKSLLPLWRSDESRSY